LNREEKELAHLSLEKGVATITIDNPPVNVLSTELLKKLEQILGAALAQGARAVVLTGAGRFFSAGADLKEIAVLTTAQEGQEKSRLGHDLLDKIEQSPVPVIAAINGTCLGGGVELAQACHIRICSERARLGQPEINLGIMPGWGGTQRLPRLVGRGKALDMVLSGDPITADEAKEAGLVDRVVPQQELLEQAQGLARRLAEKSHFAVERILRAVREGLDTTLREGLELESQLFGEVCASDDAREGISAFLEKRQAKFRRE
jgi:enoyl-CoA hydratase